MSMIELLPPCPHCGGQPQIEQCEPWPRGYGPAPWYGGCYAGGEHEHFIGGNGDTEVEARAVWRKAVANVVLLPGNRVKRK